MPTPKPIHNFIFTDHALSEMSRREINRDEVAKVLSKPEQSEVVRTGRRVYQSRLNLGEPSKEYLLRVFVDIDRDPPQVVTAYRISKIEKYLR